MDLETQKPEGDTEQPRAAHSHEDSILLKNIYVVKDFGRSVFKGLCKLASAGVAYKIMKETVVIKKGQISRMYIGECGSSKSTGKPVLELAIVEATGMRTDIRGIPDDMRQTLVDFIKRRFDVLPEDVNYEAKGWNWGDLEFDDGILSFKTDDEKCVSFNVPFSQIKNVSSNRQELLIEIVRPSMLDTKSEGGNEPRNNAIFELRELRFHVPGSGEIGERAADLKEQIGNNINIRQSDDIMTIPNVKGIIPRGTFEIRFGMSCMNMRGASYNYTVSYSNITRMFALDIPQGRSEGKALIINLSKAVRQGQTEYEQLRFDFYQDEEEDIFDINLTEEEAKEKFGADHVEVAELNSSSNDFSNEEGGDSRSDTERERKGDEAEQTKSEKMRKYKNKLRRNGNKKQNRYIGMNGTPYTCMCIVLRSLAGKNITISLGFRGVEGTFMTCYHKATQSFFYPLKNALFLMSRPCIYASHKNIKKVQFLNVTPPRQNSRGKFDLQIVSVVGTKLLFEDIDFRDYDVVKQYLANHSIISDTGTAWVSDAMNEFVEEDTDESDEDYNDDVKGGDENMDDDSSEKEGNGNSS